MDISEKIKTKFPDLIVYKTLCEPGGIVTIEAIKFKEFLAKLFPGQNKIISQDVINEMDNKIREKYNNCERNNNQRYYKSLGTLTTISINDLKFYQEYVFISGRQNSSLNDPVYVVKYKDILILKNGYHRSLIKIVNGTDTIQAYIIDIE